jgi:glutamine synthetase
MSNMFQQAIVKEFFEEEQDIISKPKYRAEVQKVIDDHQLKYVLAQFVDIHGSAKTKSVPISGLKAIEGAGVGFAGFAISGMGMQPHGPDFMVKGDLSSLTPVPWQPGYGRVVCEGYVNGKPHPYDSRYVLRKQVERLSAKGWTLNTGLEPEFSLFRRGEDGKLKAVDESDNLTSPAMTIKAYPVHASSWNGLPRH